MEYTPVEEQVACRGPGAATRYAERWVEAWETFSAEVEEVEIAPASVAHAGVTESDPAAPKTGYGRRMGERRRLLESRLTFGWRAWRSGPKREMELARSGTPARARCHAFTPLWDVVPEAPWRTRFSDRIAGGHWGSTDPHLLYSELTGHVGKADVELEVTPDEGTAYVWQGTSWVVVGLFKRLPDPTGTVLPVRIDPDDSDRVAIDWDEAVRERRRADRDRRA